MKTRLQNRFKNEKGLTLVELLAVIVILGIIAAIAVPSIGKIIENTKYNAVKADAISALNAGSLYFAENTGDDATEAGKTVKVEKLKEDGYLESIGKLNSSFSVVRGDDALTIGGLSEAYSGGKKVTFTTATLDAINKDVLKGSAKDDKVITGTP